MQEPSLELIREMLGKTLKSWSPEKLDDKAYEMYKEEKKKYEDFCNLENEKREKEIQKEKEKREKKVKEISDRIRRKNLPFE